jgi:GMP synthase-like glutamine amidotransferase
MKIHCIRHEPFEGLASIELWIRHNNHSLSYTRTYLHQRFPDEVSFDMLIIMGGTASIYERDKIPWLAAEKKFILKAVKAGKKVLGICLGAQILADLTGANVYSGLEKEIGWFPVKFNKRELPGFSFLPARTHVFHWHGDTFDIPNGAIRLASSELTPNQGFLMGENILALQFHLEMNLTSLKKLIKACSNQLSNINGSVQSAEKMLEFSGYFLSNNELMFRILDYFASGQKSITTQTHSISFG